jgi:hypothetical protein
VKRQSAKGGGQLVTLECQQTRCSFHNLGWVVTIRPDNTIPDKIDPRTRESNIPKMRLSQERQTKILEGLAAQVATEQSPGGEV